MKFFPLTIALLVSCFTLALALSMQQDSSDQEDIDKVEWWKKTNFYHIYIRSFKDSDGNGEGDIRGIIEKLDYLQRIGVETLLLSPFYSSPMKDGGYDIDNYMAVNSRFGTMKDIEDLIKGLKDRKMRLVVDFVPNHSSNKHQWFYCSERALIDPEKCGKYKDYYVWSNSTRFENSKPTNWVSLFNNGESAWKWSEIRKEFYLHQFLPEQPDLNLKNPLVREEFKNIARFWLAKGVDGLRVDAVIHFIEDTEQWRDEPPNPNYDPKDPNKYESLLHIYTKSLYESAKLVRDWQEVADEFDGDRVIITEAYDSIAKIMEYYGPSPNERFADMPFNFDLLQIFRNRNYYPNFVEELLLTWTRAVRNLNWPAKFGAYDPWTIYVSGNHDNTRAYNRIGLKNIDFYRWLSYLMPATPVDYYGDELAIQDADNSTIPKKTLEEGEPTRLAFRVPMAWTAEEPSAGFSINPDTWMPLNDNYKTNNVELLLKPESGKNHLKNYIDLHAVRNKFIKTIVFGDLVFHTNNPDESKSIFALNRPYDKKQGESLMILSNFDDKQPQIVQLLARQSELKKKMIQPPEEAKVVLTNFNSNDIIEGKTINLRMLKLEPSQSIIVSY